MKDKKSTECFSQIASAKKRLRNDGFTTVNRKQKTMTNRLLRPKKALNDEQQPTNNETTILLTIH